MQDFTFTGDWEYKIEFPAFAGFQSRQGAYNSIDSDDKSIGLINVVFEDDINDNEDPYPEQQAALQFIINNQQQIAAAMIQRIKQELPGIITDYGLEGETAFEDHSDENIKNLIGISEIRILIPSKDGIAYYDMPGGCNWDEEHGLNFLMHGTRIITFGIQDGGSYWEAVKDNGTYETVKDQKDKTAPRIYEPGPKYGKLKPSHAWANRYYEFSLIDGFHNEEFKELIRSGKRSVDYKHPDWGFFASFISRAIQFNNQELVTFLLENKANLTGIIHDVGRNKEKIEMLLANGISINEKNHAGHTLLRKELLDLRNQLQNRDMAKKNSLGYHNDMIRTSNETKEYIKWLLEKGADPFAVDMPSILSFWGRDYDTEQIKAELLESVGAAPKARIDLPEPAKPSTMVRVDTQHDHKPSEFIRSRRPPTKKWWQFWK